MSLLHTATVFIISVSTPECQSKISSTDAKHTWTTGAAACDGGRAESAERRGHRERKESAKFEMPTKLCHRKYAQSAKRKEGQ